MSESSAAASTCALPPRRRRWWRVLVGLAFLLLIGLVVLLLSLPALGTWLAARALRQRGLVHARVAVRAITLDQTVIGPVDLGTPGDLLTIDRVVVGYHLGGLLHGRLDQIEVSGLTAELEPRDGQWRVRGLDEVQRYLAGSAGGGGVQFREVVVRDTKIIVHHPRRTVSLPVILSVRQPDATHYDVTVRAMPGGDSVVVSGSLATDTRDGALTWTVPALRLEQLGPWVTDQWPALKGVSGVVAGRGRLQVQHGRPATVEGQLSFEQLRATAGPLLPGGAGVAPLPFAGGTLEVAEAQLRFALQQPPQGPLAAHVELMVSGAAAGLTAAGSGETVTVTAHELAWRQDVQTPGLEHGVDVTALSGAGAVAWQGLDWSHSVPDRVGEGLAPLFSDLAGTTSGHATYRFDHGLLTNMKSQLTGALQGEVSVRHPLVRQHLGAITELLLQRGVTQLGVASDNAEVDLTITRTGESLQVELQPRLGRLRLAAHGGVGAPAVALEFHGLALSHTGHWANGQPQRQQLAVNDGSVSLTGTGWPGLSQLGLTARQFTFQADFAGLANPSTWSAALTVNGAKGQAESPTTAGAAQVTVETIAVTVESTAPGAAPPRLIAALAARGGAVEAPFGRWAFTDFWACHAGTGDWGQGDTALTLQSGEVRAGDLHVAPFSVNATAAGRQLAVAAGPLVLTLGESVRAVAGFLGEARLAPDGAGFSGSGGLDVTELWSGDVSVAPVSVQIVANPTQMVLRIPTVAVPTAPEARLDGLWLGLSPLTADPVVRAEGTVAVEVKAAAQRVPVLAGGQGSFRLGFRAAAQPLAAARPWNLVLAAPSQPFSIEGGGRATHAQLGLGFEVMGDLARVRARGAATVTECRGGWGTASWDLARAELRLREAALPLPATPGAWRDVGQHLVATGSLKVAGKELAYGRHLSLADPQLQLPFAWAGKAGFVDVPGTDPGAFRASTVTCRSVRTTPLDWPCRLSGRRLTCQAALADQGGGLSVQQEVVAEWRGEPVLSAVGTVTADDLGKTLAGVRGVVELPALAELKITGVATIQDQLAWHAGVLDGKANVVLRNVDLGLESQGIKVHGLETTVAFPTLVPLTSAPHQTLVFRAAEFAGVPVDGGRLQFCIEDASRVFLEQCELNWCGGTVRAHAVSFSLASPDFDLVLYTDRIELGQVFALQSVLQGQAQGQLYGRLPLSFRGGKVYYKDGYLYSVPGNAGLLRLGNAETLMRVIPRNDDRIGQVERSLQDMVLEYVRLDFEGVGKTGRLHVRLFGTSAVDPELPPVKLHTSVETDWNLLFSAKRYYDNPLLLGR